MSHPAIIDDTVTAKTWRRGYDPHLLDGTPDGTPCTVVCEWIDVEGRLGSLIEHGYVKGDRFAGWTTSDVATLRLPNGSVARLASIAVYSLADSIFDQPVDAIFPDQACPGCGATHPGLDCPAQDALPLDGGAA